MGRFHSLVCLTIATLTLMLIICAKQVFADVPAVTSVVPWQLGNDTMLNVTVYHSQEVQTHHVNNIVVTFDVVLNHSLKVHIRWVISSTSRSR